VIRKAIIPLLALTVIAVTSPTATFARGGHYRAHVGYGPYGPVYDGYRPYADSCHTVRYRVATPYGWRITCRSDYWAWWQ
jgi:hypothetical protein